ncbi:MAG: DUF2905 domain-containing protein [Chthoniobacterales bacterium]
MPEIGKMLVLFGVVIVLLGLALWSGFGGSWLGRLPGDIRIERGQSSFYFPIVTCIIISVVLSLLLSFFRR